MVKNILEARPTISLLVSKTIATVTVSVIQLMASLFYLVLFVQVSSQKWLSDQGNRARSRVRIDYIIVCTVPHSWTGLLSHNLKP
jgi:hypothetical protein